MSVSTTATISSSPARPNSRRASSPARMPMARPGHQWPWNSTTRWICSCVSVVPPMAALQATVSSAVAGDGTKKIPQGVVSEHVDHQAGCGEQPPHLRGVRKPVPGNGRPGLAVPIIDLRDIDEVGYDHQAGGCQQVGHPPHRHGWIIEVRKDLVADDAVEPPGRAPEILQGGVQDLDVRPACQPLAGGLHHAHADIQRDHRAGVAHRRGEEGGEPSGSAPRLQDPLARGDRPVAEQPLDLVCLRGAVLECRPGGLHLIVEVRCLEEVHLGPAIPDATRYLPVGAQQLTLADSRLVA